MSVLLGNFILHHFLISPKLGISEILLLAVVTDFVQGHKRNVQRVNMQDVLQITAGTVICQALAFLPLSPPKWRQQSYGKEVSVSKCSVKVIKLPNFLPPVNKRSREKA